MVKHIPHGQYAGVFRGDVLSQLDPPYTQNQIHDEHTLRQSCELVSFVSFVHVYEIMDWNHLQTGGYNRDLPNVAWDVMGNQRGDSRGQFRSWFRFAGRVPDTDKNWNANKK